MVEKETKEEKKKRGRKKGKRPQSKRDERDGCGRMRVIA